MGGAQPTLFGSLSLSIQARQRHVAVRLVHVADDGAASALFDEAHAFPDEDCGAKAVVFGDPAAYGVVVEPGGLGGCVFGAGAPGGGDCCEAAFFVPFESLGGVFAAELLDQTRVRARLNLFNNDQNSEAFITLINSGRSTGIEKTAPLVL